MVRPITVAVAALAALTVCGWAPPATAPRDDDAFAAELERAGELLDAGKSRAALAAYSKLERSHPEVCIDCLLGIAAASVRLEGFAEAEKSARRVIESTADPSAQIMAYNLLGVSFYNRTPLDGSPKELEANMTQAEAAFRRAYQLEGGRSEMVRWNLASALEWLGRAEADALFSDPGAPISVADAPTMLREEDVQEPRVLARVQPEYTDRARQQRIEGTVILETVIDTDGKVTSVKVIQGLRGCTMEAIRAAR